VRRSIVSVSGLLAERLATKSEHTRKAYERDLQVFADYVGLDVDESLRKLIASPVTVAQSVVLGYQASLANSGFAPGTINRRISALRSVLKIARAAGLTDLRLEAVENLDPEEGSRDVRGPGVVVLREIIALCDADTTPRGVRDARILRWFLGTGLRRSELRQMMLGDLRQGEDGWAVWVRAKGVQGKKKRPVAIEPWLIDDLEIWLAIRGRAPGPIFGSLHRGYKGKMLNTQGLNQILRRRAEEAGHPLAVLENGRRVTPHAIRHTAITEVVRADGLAAGQAFARHKNPATTQRYNDAKEQLARAGQRTIAAKLRS
jgi:integrase/recombinase XerC